VPAGVRQQPEGSGEFRSLKKRVLVIGLELENLLVDGVGSREKALRAKAVGDADEAIDRLVNPTRPDVQIPKSVSGRPVSRLVVRHARVLLDGRVEIALAQQFFSVPERGSAIECH
jgi:hypothetical protein